VKITSITIQPETPRKAVDISWCAYKNSVFHSSSASGTSL